MSNQNPYAHTPDPQNDGYGRPQQSQQGYGQPGPGQPGYGYPQGGAPGYGAPDPHAPYGYDPYGRPYSPKSKIAAGLLQIFLGVFGVGRWYTGHVGIAIGQLLTCGGFGIWSLIDGIMLLTQQDPTDKQGRPLRG